MQHVLRILFFSRFTMPSAAYDESGNAWQILQIIALEARRVRSLKLLQDRAQCQDVFPSPVGRVPRCGPFRRVSSLPHAVRSGKRHIEHERFVQRFVVVAIEGLGHGGELVDHVDEKDGSPEGFGDRPRTPLDGRVIQGLNDTRMALADASGRLPFQTVSRLGHDVL